jgi:hypothetical protein
MTEKLVTLRILSRLPAGTESEIGTIEVTTWQVHEHGYLEAVAGSLESFAEELRKVEVPDGPTEDRG